MKRLWTVIFISLFIFLSMCGCNADIDEPFYKQSLDYEKKAFQLNKQSIDNDRYSPEQFQKNREEAAKAAGFSSLDEADKKIESYINSEDPQKQEIAQKIIDNAMKYRKKLNDYRKLQLNKEESGKSPEN